MITGAVEERRGAIAYIVFLVITLVVYSSFLSDQALGVLALVWGFLGFYRYRYLSSSHNKKIPQILTLPSRILFDLDQQQRNKIDLIIDRFLKTDVLIFAICAFLFILWGVYTSLFPADVPLVQDYWEEKKNIIDVSNAQNYYLLLKSLSVYLMMGMIFFIGLSYSENVFFLKKINIYFLSLVLMGAIYIAYIFPLSSFSPYIDVSYLKGMGWGSFRVFEKLMLENQYQFSSGFFKRYIELGIIGSIGFYIIFLPIFFQFVRVKICFQNMMCAIVLVFVMALDLYWISNSFIQSFQILILSYVICFWGHLGSQTLKS